MKKLISLILVLCLACMLMPAGAEDSLTGRWYLNELTVQELTVNAAQADVSWTFDINEDGTFAMEMEQGGNRQEGTGTWTRDGDRLNLEYNGSETIFIIEDDALIFEMENEAGRFTREAPESGIPSPVAAESGDVFNGFWELCAISMSGVYITSDMFEALGMNSMNMTLAVKGGKAILASTMAVVGDQVPIDAVFRDGKLVLASGDLDLFTLELTDNGSLSLPVSSDGQVLVAYLARSEEPAE